MVPKYDKLIEFSGLLSELIRDTTELFPEEIEIRFKAPKDVIERVNEDFWYRTGHEGKDGYKSVDEIDIRLNGMNFIYENNGRETGKIELEEDEKVVDKPDSSGRKGGILGWFRRRKDKPAKS